MGPSSTRQSHRSRSNGADALQTTPFTTAPWSALQVPRGETLRHPLGGYGDVLRRWQPCQKTQAMESVRLSAAALQVLHVMALWH